MSELLTFRDVQAETGLTLTTIQDSARSGRLKTIAPGRGGVRSQCTREALDAWLALRAIPQRGRVRGPRAPRPTPTALSIREVARHVKCADKCVRHAIERGHLVVIAGSKFIERDAVDAWATVRVRRDGSGARKRVERVSRPKRRTQGDERAVAKVMAVTERGLASKSPRRKTAVAAEPKPRHSALQLLDQVRARSGRAT